MGNDRGKETNGGGIKDVLFTIVSVLVYLGYRLVKGISGIVKDIPGSVQKSFVFARTHRKLTIVILITWLCPMIWFAVLYGIYIILIVCGGWGILLLFILVACGIISP